MYFFAQAYRNSTITISVLYIIIALLHHFMCVAIYYIAQDVCGNDYMKEISFFGQTYCIKETEKNGLYIISDASLELKGLLAIKFVDVNLFSWGNSLELQKHRKHH